MSNKSLSPNRRRALGLGVASLGAMAFPTILQAQNAADLRVNVVGGGIAGTHCARLIRKTLGARAAVTLISPDINGYTPPFSRTDEMFGAARERISVASVLRRDGVISREARVSDLDPVATRLTLTDGGGSLEGDLIVVATGIDFVDTYAVGQTSPKLIPPLWDSMGKGVPPGWLDRVVDGEQVVIVAPPQPYRCPPAIYERVCLLGERLRARGTKARIVIIDNKNEYPMQGLFEAAYTDYLNDMVEWIPLEFHGGIERINVAAGEVRTAFERFKADWVHIVPKQRGPKFLEQAGLTDNNGFGVIRPKTMASRDAPTVHILGDSSAAHEMSKSADSAMVHAEIAANAIIGAVNPAASGHVDVIEDRCWTYVAENDAVTLYGRYEMTDKEFHAIGRAVSNVSDPESVRESNAARARAWPAHIIDRVFGESH